MSNISRITLERIDHGVLPSNDLGRAFRFWSTFMGGQIGFHTNLNVRGLNREVPMIIFMTVANHRGFGLALQDFRTSPTPARRREGIVWGLEVADNDLAAATAVAEKQNLRSDEASYPEMLKRFNRKETYWGPDPNLIPWHEPDSNTAYVVNPPHSKPGSG